MNKKKLIKSKAYDLFLKNQFELASVNSIVKEASIAKGTYYLYYQTKEEVYLDILADFYQKWFTHINSILNKDIGFCDFLKELVFSFIEDKKFLELLCRSSLILEKNISKESIIHFKNGHKAGLSEISHKVSIRFEISEEIAIHKLLLTYASIIGVYQASKIPSSLCLKDFEQLKCLSLNFEDGINDIIYKIWEFPNKSLE